LRNWPVLPVSLTTALTVAPTTTLITSHPIN
jgi:hypothetical protein